MDIDEDLKALQETIAIVEANPARFRLDVREIQERKGFVERTRRTVMVWFFVGFGEEGSGDLMISNVFWLF